MADKREVEVDIASASVEVLGREIPLFVAIMDIPESLLGAGTLETLGLAIDLTSSLSERLPCKPDLWYTVYLLGKDADSREECPWLADSKGLTMKSLSNRP